MTARRDLARSAAFFWEERGSIDRCVFADDIYEEFPEIKKAMKKLKKAQRRLTRIVEETRVEEEERSWPVPT